MPTKELSAPTPLPDQASGADLLVISKHEPPSKTIWQFLRFGLVGCLNTMIDLLALNCLLWLWPTQNTTILLLDNSLAYTLGAINSFLLNRYWTFQRTGRTNTGEVMRFALTVLAGTAYNDLVLWFLNSALHPSHLSPTLWTNISKIVAIASAVLISFLAMRLWVFMQASPHALEYPWQKKNTGIMATSDTRTRVNWPEPLADQNNSSPRLWQRLALGVVILVSIFLNFYQLGQNGFGNLFYAAGVRSMADSLHNFFFVSYDPGGFVTIDKPPLGFWLQAISVKIFGFTPFSTFLPQALAGVLAVLILFFLVRRHFGFTAGLLAALALALSPLSVVTNRNNTIDSTLALTLLLGAWAIMRAAETGKLRWLLLSAALVGIGFNIKMMEAYLIVPAFGLLYLLAAPLSLWRRIGQLMLATVFLLAVSLSWAIVVDLIPPSQRPYVGSSQNNSEIGLAFGYNGVDRLLGRFGLGGNRGSATGQRQLPTSGTGNETNGPFTGPGNGEQRANGGFRGFGSGSPGPLRLFDEPLGGQIAWLLPVALLGMLALAWQRRPRFQRDRQQQSLLLWGTWLLTMATFFSIAGFFHQYYMTTFAPAICALFGIGLVVMWQDYQRTGWRGWLLPLAILATACEQIHIITSNPAWGAWLIPLIAIPCVIAALVMSVVRLMRARFAISPRVLAPAFSLGVAALLLTPAIWSAMPSLQNIANRTPVAGPTRQDDFSRFARDDTTTDPVLIRYLEENQGNEKFLVATPSSMSADSIILATNEPVMAMGGFFGADPILTVDRLASLIHDGTVRFFLLNDPSRLPPFTRGNSPAAAQNRPFGGFGFGRNVQSALTTWITKHCAAVTPGKWQPAATSGTSGNASLLYDCAAAR